MTIEAYAKINFTLEVFGKRADGYHRLRSLVLPITLADSLLVEKSERSESNLGYENDLCIKAAQAIGGEARILVTKRIPAGGGLGGGSADAAAVLKALNALYELGKTPEELAAIGARVGSDVPALTLGGAVLMEGRGEIVERVDLPPINIVLVDTKVASSTAEVYRHAVARAEGGENLTARAIAAIRSGDFAAMAAATMNDLQGPAIALHAEIGEAIAALKKAGGAGVTMTGSGACVFALAKDEITAVEISNNLKQQGYRAWALKTR